MLNQADFYILKQDSEQARRHFTCRLVHKIYRQKISNIAIQTANQAESALLDELLWTFEDISFIPHDISQTFNEVRPIIIHHESINDKAKIILNLSDAPIQSNHVERICEVITAEPKSTQLARERFKQYQTQSVKLNTFKI